MEVCLAHNSCRVVNNLWSQCTSQEILDAIDRNLRDMPFLSLYVQNVDVSVAQTNCALRLVVTSNHSFLCAGATYADLSCCSRLFIVVP
jgi:hypothetical protein